LEFWVRIEFLTNCRERFFDFIEDGVVGGGGGEKGCGIGALEGMDCDGWFGSFDGGGIKASWSGEDN
jgi:hypothetical protein